MCTRHVDLSARRAFGLLLCFVLWLSSIAAVSERPPQIAIPASDQWLSTAPIQPVVAGIAVDPMTADTAYAATWNSRVFKTTNGGANWTEKMLPVGSYEAPTVHLTNPNIVYVTDGVKVFKSINAGLSWFGLSNSGGLIKVIAVDPTNTTTLYTGSDGDWGIYKTINSGVTWTRVQSDTSILALAIDPTQSNIVFAGGKTYAASAGGIFRSTDAGATWNRVLTSVKVTALAIDPSNTQIIYAGMEDYGVMKSTDGGQTWLEANTGLTYPVVSSLAIDPLRPRVLYAGTQGGGVFRSLDGGAYWSELNAGLPAGAEITALSISADRGVVYALTSTSAIFKWTGPPPPPPGSTYAHVVDEHGSPLSSAQIYRNGRLVTAENGDTLVTDLAGNLVLTDTQVGDTLVALIKQDERPSARRGGADWAYRSYTTSLSIQPDGSLRALQIRASGAQTLTVEYDQPLVLFNLVVSIEWDADPTYTDAIARAMRQASDYLNDMTDGQMAFGEVTIYDNGSHWSDADIQIAASNIVRPHAYVGGIADGDRAHVMRIGRAWDGNSGSQGAWDVPAGYRTLTHEFGHYALHLYDEYFAYVFDQNGRLIGERPASCTGPANRNPATDTTNASVMDYQYASSELAMRDVPGLWSSLCQLTAQWQLNQKSDWETLIERYADTAPSPRWQFTTPAMRGGPLAGPTGLPSGVLDLPTTKVRATGSAGQPRPLIALDPAGKGLRGALVALYKQDGRVIGQGQTNNNGQIDIYGVVEGDTVRASSLDGGLAGMAEVKASAPISIQLTPVGSLAVASAGSPHIRVVAQPSQSPDQVDLLMSLQNFDANAPPNLLVTVPGSQVGYAPALSYSPTTGSYVGQISFSAVERGTGRVQVVGKAEGSVVTLQSSYRLQRVINAEGYNAYANDGNLELRLEAGTLPGNEAYIVVMPPGASPGSIPPGLALIGDIYDLTVSGAATLLKPALLSMRYDKALVNTPMAPAGMAIYHWDGTAWQPITSELNEQHKTMTAPVAGLGVYALMAPPGPWAEPHYESFLPITRR